MKNPRIKYTPEDFSASEGLRYPHPMDVFDEFDDDRERNYKPDLEPEMQEEDTGQSSPRINETDLQIALCGLLIKKKILAFVPQGGRSG